MKNENEKMGYMTITLAENMLNELTKISKKHKISRSFIVRELINKFVWDYKKTGKIF